MRTKCTFSGSGGQGSALLAKLICKGAMKQGLQVVMTQTYGIEQRGGDSTGYVVVSDTRIGNPLVENDADVSVALSPTIYDGCLDGSAIGGLVLVNSSMIMDTREREGVKQILIPASDIAAELGSVRCANIVMLGAVLEATNVLEFATVEEVLRDLMGAKKPALLEMNLKALQKGRTLYASAAE
ncbi:2-oxoacid:acceptor oxidoreductase family protein [Maridesulfovibrio ferrireducens]|uniref:2-oxoacid:acceptor oxidoreductase family protein n=1 Tax=Maridesulfovibrio ferrireducens TaxID=246191 RepID=UPI001A1DCCE7|nr:2-oxoacid:acceptor oxidoreductase family protein [Maridesulfovibrio ferrireducens]MBI9111074.1 2-oxoacid:acceptor oxidoreductase family protein [Maridesulfovibrio ferrireducens]